MTLREAGRIAVRNVGVDEAHRTGQAAPTLPISAFVICQDEEAGIESCLRSLSRCHEIVVVDSGSTDATIAIIERLQRDGLPIRLFHQSWLGYASQKQFALSQATQPWCLSLDADEQLDEILQDDLARLVAAPGVAGWKLRRLPTAMGDFGAPPRGVYAKPIVRLVRREGARFDERALVHEGLLVPGPVRVAGCGLIRHALRLPFAEQVHKELRYAALKASERVARGRAPSRMRLVFSPAWYFFRYFVLHRWALCGRAGFVFAVQGAIYAFAVETMHFDLVSRRSGGHATPPGRR